MNRAEDLLNRGEIARALSALDETIAAAPDHARALRLKGILHRMLGEVERARQTFDRLLALEPENAESWLDRGWSLLEEGKAEEALASADRALGADEWLVDGHVLRGDSLLALERWEDAFEAFRRAAECDRDVFTASKWSARGDAFSQGEQLDLALRAYEQAIEQESDNPEGWHGKGLVLKRQDDVEGAVRALAHASECDRDFIAGFLEAGAARREQGDDDAALAFFRKAQEAQPEDSRAWRAEGDIHWNARRYGEAADAYRAAVDADPDDVDAWNALGSCFFFLNRLDDAAEALRRAIEVDADAPWPHYNLALVSVHQRRWEEAERASRRATELEPGNGDFWATKLFVLDRSGSLGDGEIDGVADEVLAAIGDDVAGRVGVAHFLVDNGRAGWARDLVRDVGGQEFGPEERLDFAELLLKVDRIHEAYDLLQSIQPSALIPQTRIACAFLNLLAERLTGPRHISPDHLAAFLRSLREAGEEIRSLGAFWSFKGVVDLLRRADLPELEKFVFATLIDLQTGKVSPDDLSFFSSVSGDAEPAPPTQSSR